MFKFQFLKFQIPIILNSKLFKFQIPIILNSKFQILKEIFSNILFSNLKFVFWNFCFFGFWIFYFCWILDFMFWNFYFIWNLEFYFLKFIQRSNCFIFRYKVLSEIPNSSAAAFRFPLFFSNDFLIISTSLCSNFRISSSSTVSAN